MTEAPAPTDPHAINTLQHLEALLGQPSDASLSKEVPYIHPAYCAMIEAAPFAVLATTGPGGLDASPRGDPPGFVQLLDDRTLLLPERRGNNRADSLRNIVADPRVALLFLIPGVGETLRVNGRARITADPALLARFAVEGKAPQCVIEIAVETVFFQCARAIQRSRLWAPRPDEARPDVPTPGAILSALTDAAFDGASYDRELPARQKATLY